MQRLANPKKCCNHAHKGKERAGVAYVAFGGSAQATWKGPRDKKVAFDPSDGKERW